MNVKLVAALLAILVSTNTIADLKPDIIDCDPKKAARNAAMDATVGISGRCDTAKAAENSKENVVDAAKDSVDVDLDKKNRNLGSKNDEHGLKKNKD